MKQEKAKVITKAVSIISSVLLLIFVVGGSAVAKNGEASGVYANRHVMRLGVVSLAAGAMSHVAMQLMRRINKAEALVKRANEAKYRKVRFIWKVVTVSSGAVLLIFVGALGLSAGSGDIGGLFANEVFVKVCTAVLSFGTFAPPFIALFIIMREAEHLEKQEKESEGETA